MRRFRSRKIFWRRRRGYTLVFFAMILFGLLALAALVIDVGFARLAQRQMLTAVDAAAVEGLRFRDDPSLPEEQRDAARRQRASDIVAWTFDDDLLDSLSDAKNLGAGPLLNLSGGVGHASINAGRLITIPTNPVYKPTRSDGTRGLEPNPGNQTHGDMVAGTYVDDPTVDHEEGVDYSRDDFVPASENGEAFLVRMRRTNDFMNLDNVANVSTSGPSIPLLFGRGALMPAGDPDSEYSLRHHGVTVRGTSIAEERPAMSIGLANDSISPALPGLAPISLELSYWNSLTTDSATNATIAGGIITGQDLGTGGRCFVIRDAETMPLVLGRVAPAAEAIPDGTYSGYVSIFDNIPGDASPRIVGFGELDATVSGGSTLISITRRPSRLATENASAVVVHSVPVSGDALTAILALLASVQEPLLAPASVR